MTHIDKPSSVLHKGRVSIVQTADFKKWFSALRDRHGRIRIAERLKRLANSNAGDTKAVGSGVQELRLQVGPGYRIYYKWQENALIILLIGGDKSSQRRDIALAKRLAEEAESGIEGISF